MKYTTVHVEIMENSTPSTITTMIVIEIALTVPVIYFSVYMGTVRKETLLTLDVIAKAIKIAPTSASERLSR
jgi:hypothetical protein